MNTQDFLHELYGGCTSGFLEVTYLCPDGLKLYPRTVVQWAPLPLPPIDYENSTAHRMNQRGYGVYFGVAVRREQKPPEQRVSDKTGKPYTFYPRGNQSDALYLPALYVDIDDPSDAARWRIWELCPPTMIVASGGGWHGYWVLNTPLLITEDNHHEIKRTLKGMAVAVGGDTKVAELARIMRLPGTVNTKPERGGVSAHVVEDLSGARFRFEDFQRKYAHLGGARELQIDRHVPVEARQTEFPAHIKAFIESGVVFGEGRNTSLLVTARYYNDMGLSQSQAEAELLSVGMSLGLGEQECLTTIRSAFRYAPNPTVANQNRFKMAVADHLQRLRGKRGA